MAKKLRIVPEELPKSQRHYFNATEDRAYVCDGPFEYGHSKALCIHGWATYHCLNDQMAQLFDSLYASGIIPARQRIEKIER